MDKAAKARVNAQGNTGWQNLLSKTDANTKRMAGAALLGILAPSIASKFEGEENSYLNEMLGGGVSLVGTGLGGYLGHKAGTIAPEHREQYIRDNIDILKAESKAIGREQDAAAAVQYFADKKRELLDDISPIDAKRAIEFNHIAKQFTELGEMVAELNILKKTPRQVRGMTRGAALGALATAIPAYLLMEQGSNE